MCFRQPPPAADSDVLMFEPLCPGERGEETERGTDMVPEGERAVERGNKENVTQHYFSFLKPD